MSTEKKDNKSCFGYIRIGPDGGYEITPDVFRPITKEECERFKKEWSELFGGAQIINSAWQDMSSAPKDGTRVLLYFPDGYWVTGEKIADGFFSTDGSENWFYAESDSSPMDAFGSKPTMWQSLPAEPSDAVK